MHSNSANTCFQNMTSNRNLILLKYNKLQSCITVRHTLRNTSFQIREFYPYTNFTMYFYKDLLESQCQREREVGRDISSICWFTPQIVTMARAGLGQSQNLHPSLPCGCTSPSTWAIFHCISRESEVHQPGLKLRSIKDASVTGSRIIDYAKMTLPSFSALNVNQEI